MAGPMESEFLGESDVIDDGKDRDVVILIQIHKDQFGGSAVSPCPCQRGFCAGVPTSSSAGRYAARAIVTGSRAEQSSNSVCPTRLESSTTGPDTSLNLARSTVPGSAVQRRQPAPVRRIYKQQFRLRRLGCVARFSLSRKASTQRRDRETRC